jgi:predicted GIY-YIG superfamily endonuclease
MWYVYILRSQSHPDEEYTGASQNLRHRISDHNAGKSPHTAKCRPWRLLWYGAFSGKMQALAFEAYLKSHSGRAFAKKRLIPGFG